jgi:multidrug resistance protein
MSDEKILKEVAVEADSSSPTTAHGPVSEKDRPVELEHAPFKSEHIAEDGGVAIRSASKTEKWQLAAAEGHDADIPTNEGVLTSSELKDIEAGNASSDGDSAVERVDPNIVWWDSDDDPKNPMNWASRKKVVTIAIVSAITFVTPLASSMFAPGVPALMTEFNSDNLELASFVVSVYVLGFAVGPIVLAPLSELYGRLLWYNVCNVLFTIFTVACALSTNLNMLIGFRFLAGCVGAAPLTIGGGSIADMIVQEKRGSVMAIYALGPLLGPVIGPIIGGYLAAAKGWRWVFWLLAIIAGTNTVLTVLFMRETYAPTILLKKTKRLQKETGNMNLRSKLDTGKTPAELFKHSIIRPIKMLIYSPIVLGLSLMMAIQYGYMYLLFTTFDLVFEEQYGFSTGSIGLSYLGIGIGCLVGLGIFGYASDKILKIKSAKGEMKPEYRLPPIVYGAPLVPIGLFWYGWSAQAKIHWIMPIIGTCIVGFGLIAYFVSCVINLSIYGFHFACRIISLLLILVHPHSFHNLPFLLIFGPH